MGELAPSHTLEIVVAGGNLTRITLQPWGDQLPSSEPSLPPQVPLDLSFDRLSIKIALQFIRNLKVKSI